MLEEGYGQRNGLGAPTPQQCRQSKSHHDFDSVEVTAMALWQRTKGGKWRRGQPDLDGSKAREFVQEARK
jgi:hypothetical protein